MTKSKFENWLLTLDLFLYVVICPSFLQDHLELPDNYLIFSVSEAHRENMNKTS